MERKSFKAITEDIKTDEGLNIRDTACFHYFNPNGLIASWKNNCERISALVDAGKVKSGWIMAYGSMDDYSYRKISKYAMSGRVSRLSLDVTLRTLEEDIKKVDKLINLKESK